MSTCAQCNRNLVDSAVGRTCPSCNWRWAIRASRAEQSSAEADACDPSWSGMLERLQDLADGLPRLRYFAMLVGEDGLESERRVANALANGDDEPYREEVLRLAYKFMAGIEDF